MRALFLILSIIFSVSYGYNFEIKVLSESDLSNFNCVETQVSHTGTDAFIRKVTDGKSVYILKQIRDSSISEQFLLINDAVASNIGYHAGVKVNNVFFIPYSVANHLKYYPNQAATLHEYVKGVDLEQAFPDHLQKDFNIQQRVINPDSEWQKKYPLKANMQGMNIDVIENMCCHENLALLAALDTFIGNCDRSLPNIFYDQCNKVFSGIDQAAAFSKKLAKFACDRFKEYINDGYFYKCSVNVKNGLKLYRNTLVKLKDKFAPHIIINSINSLVIHLCPNASLNSQVRNRLRFHTSLLEDNYLFVLELIALLDQILQ